MLLNLFQAWCNWSGFEVRHDKCVAFSMIHKNHKYQKILPALYICNKAVPPVPVGGAFKYLGRTFSFELKPQSMQQHLVDKLTNMLMITSNLKIHVQLKMRIFFPVYPKPDAIHLEVYDFTQTWV